MTEYSTHLKTGHVYLHIITIKTEMKTMTSTMKILKGIRSYLATLINVDIDEYSAICLEEMDLEHA